MAIKTELSFYDFRSALKADEYASWSNDAISALFDYYEQLSDDIGQDIELDTVAIRCEWTEYSVDDLAEQYSNLKEDDETPFQFAKRVEDMTTVLWLDSQTNLLVQEF